MEPQSPPPPDRDGEPKGQNLPHWKSCVAESHLKRVVIKERAATNGLAFLFRLKETLKKHEALNPSCEPRIEKISTVQSRRREFRVLVGFIGSTGSGKTTLINALLGFKNLLPTSTHRASTAVPVEISYNKSPHVNAAFRAEIIYITAEEWAEELRQLFSDLSPVRGADDDDDDGEDEEREFRINQSFDRVKCVYPHIQSREKFKSTSVEALIDHYDVQDIFGQTKVIQQSICTEFSAAIRAFIDSGDNVGKLSAHWPLLKLVKIYVKSPILENGIALLDLPGNMDSNAGRTAVAENYYKELSVTCIVACATRGISEKNAHELLEKFTKRNLQLDGLFNAESLCFVLSQTDLVFDLLQYINEHPELKASTKQDFNLMVEHGNRITEIKRQIKTTQSSRASNERLARTLLTQVTDLKAHLHCLSSGSGPVGPKRKRTNGENEKFSSASDVQLALRDQLASLEKRLKETKELVRTDRDKLSSFNRRIGHLETAKFHARSKVAAICIRSRNELSMAAIRKDYEASVREMGRTVTDTLQIHACAASLYLKYKKSEKRQYGFLTAEDTQVPAFRDWLISTTLKTRESYAQAFLEDIDNLVLSLRPWVNDTFNDLKLPPEMREVWEPQLERAVKDLQQNISKLATKTINSLKLIVYAGLYSKFPEAEKAATAKAKKTVEKWAKACHWSTHKAINKSRGHFRDSNGKEHKWNDELSLDLTKTILPDWDQTLFQQVPAGFSTYVLDAKEAIANFARVAVEKEFCPQVADAIDVLRDHILKACGLLQSQSEPIFAEFRKSIRKTHRRASPAIRQCLDPMYLQCARDSGAGHYQRNKELHQRTVKIKGRAMHKAASKAIQAALDDALDAIPEKLVVGLQAAIDHIKEGLEMFFEQNSSTGTRSSTRRVASNAKINLQKDANVHFDDLAQHWANKAITFAPEPIDSDNEWEDDDDLFDVDQIGEPDSDYDDEL